jgi:hypothetical protein
MLPRPSQRAFDLIRRVLDAVKPATWCAAIQTAAEDAAASLLDHLMDMNGAAQTTEAMGRELRVHWSYGRYLAALYN